MCIDKKIIKETDGQRPKSHRVRAASRRRSSDANTERKFDRPVKEEMSMARAKKKVFAVPENNIDDSELDDEMNFELKWMLWITNPEEIEVDPLRFRPAAAAAPTTTQLKITKLQSCHHR